MKNKNTTEVNTTVKLSIKKISELAGVSVATVSRIINKSGRYSKDTEKKVLDIIDKYKYKPNMIAKGLRTNISKTIGIIIPDITNEFFSSIVRALEVILFKKGYTAFICNTDESEEIEEKYYIDLCSKGVDGIIYLSGKLSSSNNTVNIPVVFIDRTIPGNKKSIVIESDNFSGGFLATQELILKGCKNIVLIRDERSISTIEDRYRGYRDALLKNKIDYKENLVLTVYPISYESAKASIKKIIAENIDFDGIFATTDWMALGAIDALRESGKRVPDEIKVVGYDDISISKFSYIPITTIKQDVNKMAESAVDLLMNLMVGKEVEVKTYHTPVSLIKRDSC